MSSEHDSECLHYWGAAVTLKNEVAIHITIDGLFSFVPMFRYLNPETGQPQSEPVSFPDGKAADIALAKWREGRAK